MINKKKEKKSEWNDDDDRNVTKMKNALNVS